MKNNHAEILMYFYRKGLLGEEIKKRSKQVLIDQFEMVLKGKKIVLTDFN